MFKILALLAMILVSLNAFSIYETALSYRKESLKDINWPFTVCGKGSWTPQSLTLASTPARNTNDDITVVRYLSILDWKRRWWHLLLASRSGSQAERSVPSLRNHPLLFLFLCRRHRPVQIQKLHPQLRSSRNIRSHHEFQGRRCSQWMCRLLLQTLIAQ